MGEKRQKHKRQSAFNCSNILVLQSFDLRTWKEVDILTRLGLSESKLTTSFFAKLCFKKAGSQEVLLCTLEQRHRGDEAGLDGVEGVLHGLPRGIQKIHGGLHLDLMNFISQHGNGSNHDVFRVTAIPDVLV